MWRRRILLTGLPLRARRWPQAETRVDRGRLRSLCATGYLRAQVSADDEEYLGTIVAELDRDGVFELLEVSGCSALELLQVLAGVPGNHSTVDFIWRWEYAKLHSP